MSSTTSPKDSTEEKLVDELWPTLGESIGRILTDAFRRGETLDKEWTMIPKEERK